MGCNSNLIRDTLDIKDIAVNYCSYDKLFLKEVILSHCEEKKTNNDMDDITDDTNTGEDNDNIEDNTDDNNTGGDIGTEEPDPPSVNTEWAIVNIVGGSYGSSCGRSTIIASRIKDDILVYSELDVLPTVQQVADEIIAGNYTIEVNNAILDIDPEATDWVLDLDNNAVKYIEGVEGIYGWTADYAETTGKYLSTAQEFCRVMYDLPTDTDYGQNDTPVLINVVVSDDHVNCIIRQNDSVISGSSGNYLFNPDSEPFERYKYISINAVAKQVIENAKACNSMSIDRMYKTVTSLAHSGFYNNLFEDNIIEGTSVWV